MVTRQPARLNGSLLVRKGEALPSITPAPWAPLSDGGAGPATVRGARPDEGAEGDPGGKRVAMTLRLTQPLHRRLKLFAAHGGRSAQDIMARALEDYLRRHATPREIGFCPCLSLAGDDREG